ERAAAGALHPPGHYPSNALATFTTHDLPTFTGWMSGHDLAVKRAIGGDPGETDDERAAARAALCAAVASGGRGGTCSFDDVAGFLGGAATRVVVIAIEALLGVMDQIIVPSTVALY